MSRLMIMAGGTGGHVMPALAVAYSLEKKGVEIFWLGSEGGLESRLVPNAGINLDLIKIKGLRQSGWRRKLMMPFMLVQACIQALAIILKRKPDALLGMGGFVSGPGGLMAGLLRKPLLIHEQNAVAGLTNKWLSLIATKVLSGFPEAEGIKLTEWVGNPVRQEIIEIISPSKRLSHRQGPLRVLVIGGSQGAQVFNLELPRLLFDSRLQNLEVRHQCGLGKQKSTQEAYRNNGIQAEVTDFINDMADAYSWSDVVICRAGAMTVSEVCAAGVAALFVPYPHAVNDHQTKNAQYLSDQGAALTISQEQFITGIWLDHLVRYSDNRNQLIAIANGARELTKAQSTKSVVHHCEVLLNA